MLPSVLPLIVDWCFGKVYHLEKRTPSEFPNNAIQFIEKIAGLIETGNELPITYTYSFKKFAQLLSALKVLKTLKTEYRVAISLRDYLQVSFVFLFFILNFFWSRGPMTIQKKLYVPC